MSFNQITYPGNIPIRILLKLIKNKPLYDFSKLNSHKVTNKHGRDKYHISDKCDNKLINNIFRDILPYEKYVSVYLHGSWADGTKTAFSDIDDFVVIDDFNVSRNMLIAIINILNKIDMIFCRIDRLQHHGHWITSKKELLDYDDSFIPLFIFEKGKLICGEELLRANINKEKSRRGLIRNIITTSNNIEIISKKLFSGGITSFELKCLVSSLALMPAFVFQLKGYKLTKPEAIKKADEIFSPEARILISWSTLCRRNWQVVTNDKNYLFFSSFSNLFFNPHLWRKFSKCFSPGINALQLCNLSDISIREENIKEFVNESLNYAREYT